MSACHWLIKFAPFRTSWSEIVGRGSFSLRGVRSSEARMHLQAMRRGDLVLFYQSQQDQAIMGLLEVTREAYRDSTSADSQWLTCDFRPHKTLSFPVTRAALKCIPCLDQLPLFRQPRLAVMPVSPADFETILAKAEC